MAKFKSILRDDGYWWFSIVYGEKVIHLYRQVKAGSGDCFRP